MSIFQGLKDSMWVRECAVWMANYAPQHATTSKSFCREYKAHLLEQREMRKSPQEASIDVCILLIDSLAEQGFESWDLEVREYRLMAYQVGYGCLNKWPKVELKNEYIVRLFRSMAVIDSSIWKSPLAKSMEHLLI